jgi:pimeloyl-ACP methyl ester carboxylesterase
MRRWHAAFVWAGVMAAMVAGSAAFAPGAFRLALLQPARDLVFFYRELQAFPMAEELERRRPQPDETYVLAGQVGIKLDVWVPERLPAPSVLLLHGSSPRGRQLGVNLLLAESLRQSGWLVFTPDARGFGGSERPDQPELLEGWAVEEDIIKLVGHLRDHPGSDGQVVAIGHSLGGSHLLRVDHEALALSAVALIGPGRDHTEYRPTWSQRVRFSSDRRFSRLLPVEIVAEDMRRHDVLAWAQVEAAKQSRVPILLLDGEREGPKLVSVLAEAAGYLGERAQHITVSGSHHYCGAYQLPWPTRTIFIRAAVFERCVRPLKDFLDGSVSR